MKDLTRIPLAEKTAKDSISLYGLHITQHRTWTKEIASKASFVYSKVNKSLSAGLEVCTGRINNEDPDRIVWDLPTLSDDGYWVGYIQPDKTVIFNARI